MAGAGRAMSPRSSLDALEAFLLVACSRFEPSVGIGTDPRPLRLSLSLPPPHEDHTHEWALGFHFADEMVVVRQLRSRMRQGQELFDKIYCARSCASAIPPAPADTDVARTLRYYAAVYEVLKPQVAKLRMLCDYCSQTVVAISDTIQRIAAQESTHGVIPDVLLEAIVHVIDVVLQMNQLHNQRSALRNDFSLFKRAFKYVKGDVGNPDEVNKELHRLQEFVGTTGSSKGSIWDSLRHNLTSVKRYEQVILILVRFCLNSLENDRGLLPHDRFKCVRVLPCLMTVIGVDTASAKPTIGLQGTDRRLLEYAAKTVSRYPVVPIFADICTRPPSSLVHKSSDSGTHGRHKLFDLVAVAAATRPICTDYLPRLLFSATQLEKSAACDKIACTLYTLVTEGISHVMEWKTSLLLFLAMKYQSPKTNSQLLSLGIDLDNPYLEYDRVMRYNFNSTELKAILEIIHGIKSICSTLRSWQDRILPCLCQFVYDQVQQFVQQTLVPILHRADKRKHHGFKWLHDIRLICGDWKDTSVPVDDFKKRRRDRKLPILMTRSISCTPCQLEMIRTALESIVSKRQVDDGESKHYFSFHRELKSSDLDTMHQFYRSSRGFANVLRFQELVDDLCSLPELWFRELHLEMTKSTQLPIDGSFMWLLLMEAFRSSEQSNASLLGRSLLEIYNDAAKYALINVQQQCLLDEVTAEASLFLDHLVFLLAEQQYSVTKNAMTNQFIGQEYMDQNRRCSRSKHTAILKRISSDSFKSRLVVVDRICNAKLLVSGHVNRQVDRDLVGTLAKMNAVGITCFVSTQNALNITEMSCEMASKNCFLDSLEDMWREISLRAHVSQTLKSHVECSSVRILFGDLFLSFGYNSSTTRFYRASLSPELRKRVVLSHNIGPDTAEASSNVAITSSWKAVDAIGLDRECRMSLEILHKSFHGFFGLSHFEHIVMLLTPAELAQVVQQITRFILKQIEDVVEISVDVLGSAIPPYRFPKFVYKGEGSFGYFHSKFKHLFESSELEAHVFQAFRSIGNGIAVIIHIDEVLEDRRRGSQRRFLALTLEQLADGLQEADLLKIWAASSNANPESVESSSSFFLVWNAIEFLSCCPKGSTTLRDAYGDGVQVAGCVLVHLLNQRSLYELWNPSDYVVSVTDYDRVKRVTTASIERATKGKKSLSISSPISSPRTIGQVDADLIDDTRIFVAQARRMRSVTRRLFHLLENTWSRQQVFGPGAIDPPSFVPPQQ